MDSSHGFGSWVRIMDSDHGFVSWIRIMGSHQELVLSIRIMAIGLRHKSMTGDGAAEPRYKFMTGRPAPVINL